MPKIKLPPVQQGEMHEQTMAALMETLLNKPDRSFDDHQRVMETVYKNMEKNNPELTDYNRFLAEQKERNQTTINMYHIQIDEPEKDRLAPVGYLSRDSMLKLDRATDILLALSDRSQYEEFRFDKDEAERNPETNTYMVAHYREDGKERDLPSEFRQTIMHEKDAYDRFWDERYKQMKPLAVELDHNINMLQERGFFDPSHHLEWERALYTSLAVKVKGEEIQLPFKDEVSIEDREKITAYFVEMVEEKQPEFIAELSKEEATSYLENFESSREYERYVNATIYAGTDDRAHEQLASEGVDYNVYSSLSENFKDLEEVREVRQAPEYDPQSVKEQFYADQSPTVAKTGILNYEDMTKMIKEERENDNDLFEHMSNRWNLAD